MAFLTDKLSEALCLLPVVAGPAQASSGVLDESDIGEGRVAELAGEASRMPVVVHRLDHAAHNELLTLSAAGGKKHVEIMLAVLDFFVLVVETIWKLLETLSADKALFVINFSVRIDHLLVRLKATLAPDACRLL